MGSRSSRRLSLKAQKGKVCDKVSKSPANDLSRVRGLKKLFGTPKEIKLPKNDLTDVRGVRHLFQTPKSVSSPMNDLSNIVGVKKLISTPNLVKSPKNDLTEIPNLRKLIYPVQENGPKNDLSDVAGVKKLLATPKVDKSPKNDLRHVPNLRRMMSPKQQNSPKNDLSDVAGLKKLLSTSKKQKEPRNDLTNVAGVKKLLSTPKKQNSPINDLTDVPNLQRIMFPKQQNSPTNDLSDVEGVADIFAENELHSRGSDVNDENLFDMLFVRKPIKTYSGRSLSPFTRKAMLFGGDQRKTVGDMPYSSPRVKKWLEDQAVIKLERVDDVKKSEVEPLKEEFKTPKATPRGRRRKALHSEEPSSQEEKIPRGRTRAQVEINEELAAESPRSVRSRQKRNAEHVSPTNGVNSRNAPEFTQPPTERHESVKNGPENMIEQITEIHSTTDSGKDEAEKEVISQPKRRGRRRKVSLDEAVDSTEHKPNTRRRKMPKKDDDETSDIEMVSTPRRRGRPRTVLSDEQANSSGRRRKVSKKDKDGHVDINITPLRILRSKLRIADSISQELEKPTEKGNMGKVREAKESTEVSI